MRSVALARPRPEVDRSRPATVQHVGSWVQYPTPSDKPFADRPGRRPTPSLPDPSPSSTSDVGGADREYYPDHGRSRAAFSTNGWWDTYAERPWDTYAERPWDTYAERPWDARATYKCKVPLSWTR